jgi:type 1 glutamine amidotransferase
MIHRQNKRQNIFLCLALAVGMVCLVAGKTTAAETTTTKNNVAPLKVLMVTGGSSHDYDILEKGITARANVQWTIAHQGGKDRNQMIELFKSPDWAAKYDIVVHNQCFGGVTDVAFVERVAQAHYAGVPAVIIHCTVHSYRHAKTDAWRKVIGVSSFSHEKHRPLAVRNLQVEHPIMQGFPKVWNTPNGELYKIDKMWPNCKALATAFGEDTQKDHTCIWTNTIGKGKVFGTTIGHHNETMSTDVYLDLVTRGMLWACDKLDDSGKAKTGYGPVKTK